MKIGTGKGTRKGNLDKDIMDVPWMVSMFGFYESAETSADNIDLSEEDAAELAEEVQTRKMLHEALTNKVWAIAKEVLTPLQFECFYLYYCEDFKQDDIAVIIGNNQSFVTKYIKQAMDKVTKKLQEMDNKI